MRSTCKFGCLVPAIGLAILLLCGSLSHGQTLKYVGPSPAAKVNEFSAGVGKLVELLPDTDCDVVAYQSLTEGGHVHDSTEFKSLAPKAALFYASKDNTVYKIKAIGSKSVEGKGTLVVTLITVIVGTPPSPPAPPGPGPDVPPFVPPPFIPPPPADLLTAKLQAAFTVDAGTPAEKAVWLATIRGTYEAMPVHIDSLPANATTADMLADLRAAVGAAIPDPASLAGLRGTIRDELAVGLGTVVGPLDKPAAKVLFARIAKSLGGVK